MMMIVCGHLIGQGVTPCYTAHTLPILVSIVGGMSRIAVSIFLLIGTYFMVDSKFKAKRVLMLYGQLAFWILFLTFFIGLFWGSVLGFATVSIRNLFWALFPYSSKSLWFVSDYIALIMLAPFINIVIKDKNIHKLLLIILTIFVCVQPTIYIFTDSWLDGVTFFVYIYVLMAYYKHYLEGRWSPNKYIFLLDGICLYVGLMLVQHYFKVNNISDNNYLVGKTNQFISDYKTLPNLFIAISIFYFFKCTNIGRNMVINFFASSALGIYIIHQTPAFQPILWNKILYCSVWANNSYLLLHVLVAVLLLYFFLTLCSLLYTLIFERYWISSKLYLFLEKKIDSAYKNLIS